jgi:hypothetical protein
MELSGILGKWVWRKLVQVKTEEVMSVGDVSVTCLCGRSFQLDRHSQIDHPTCPSCGHILATRCICGAKLITAKVPDGTKTSCPRCAKISVLGATLQTTSGQSPYVFTGTSGTSSPSHPPNRQRKPAPSNGYQEFKRDVSNLFDAVVTLMVFYGLIVLVGATALVVSALVGVAFGLLSLAAGAVLVIYFWRNVM